MKQRKPLVLWIPIFTDRDGSESLGDWETSRKVAAQQKPQDGWTRRIAKFVEVKEGK